MIERKSGHIINIGSTAAKVYPNGVYCASKHAVDALNQGNAYGFESLWYKSWRHSSRNGTNFI
jgi:NAD(P)-dependent dehydrogenase (short-subunit alcohol dehydrogenase family)